MWIVVPVAVALLAGAVILIAARADDEVADTSGPSVSPSLSVEPLSPPEDPEAKASPFRVALSWSDDDATVDSDGYEIRRNGTWIGDVEPGVMHFVDKEAIPGRSLTYKIRTQSLDGRFSEPASIEVSTPLPPLSEARVAGTFDVRAQVTSQYGYSEYGHPTFGWRLTPSCDTRACGFRARDLVNDFTMMFTRKGGMYSASLTGRLGLACSGTPVTSNGTVELRVKKAHVIGREWRATKLVGTMRHSEAEQLGCRASGATLALNGRLVRLG
jgi:hypothetical protein